MSSRFGSTLTNYFNGGAGGGSSEGSRFVGQTVDLGDGNRLKIKKVIAEGGYGYVFVAQDVKTGTDYALKRQVVSRENVKIIKKEIAFLKQLGDHPHIIQYIASAGCPPSQTSHGNAEFLIQTELCTGGPMETVLQSTILAPQQVLRVFYATCSAVAAMHSQSPAIIHRDIKVENLILTGEGVIKLCDFGSATTQQVNPEPSWTAVQRGLAEEEIQRNTTPMYRSPEMIDLYSNHPVNEKADVWALGCLLFTLCFRIHPFEDSAKLRIINANFKIPPEDTAYTMYHNIIKSCLAVDPRHRPSVDEVIAQLFTLSDKLREDLEKPSTDLLDIAQSVQSSPVPPSDTSPSPDGSSNTTTWQSTSQQAQKFLGFMKEGAGSFFKNIKDSSSKVIHSISTANKQALDITYITSRILVMSHPHDNQMEEVKSFLDERHPSAYLVFNVSGESYDVSKLNNQVYDFAWPRRGTPDLEKIVDLCRSMDAWLRADRQNVIVVHCQGMTAVRMFQFQLHTGFLDPDTNSFVLERHDIDGSAIKKIDKFPSPFRVTLEVEWERDQDTVHRAASWQNLPYPKATPLTCFSSRTEEHEVLKLIADSDNEKTPSPHHSHHSHHPHHHSSPSTQSHTHTSTHHQPDEESTSAGGGNLLNLQGLTVLSSDESKRNHREAVHGKVEGGGDDFFSQLHWQKQNAEMSGYAAFQDQGVDSDSDSSSSGSSSSSDNDYQGQLRTPHSGGKQVHSSGNDGLIANFAAFNDAESAGFGGGQDKTSGKEMDGSDPQEEKLIDFGFPDDFGTSENSPTKSTSTSFQKESTGTSFDPWGATSHYPQYQGKSELEVSNLLGLDDSDEHSQVSDVQSEVRTVGAKQFTDRLERMGNTEKGKSSNHFDPFGPLLSSSSSSNQESGEGAPLFGLVLHPPSPAQPSHPPQAQLPASQHSHDPFDPLGPLPTFSSTKNQPGLKVGKMPRNVSTPATLASMGGGGHPVSHFDNKARNPAHGLLSTSPLSKTSSLSQPNLVFEGNNGHRKISGNRPGYRGTSSQNTSPKEGSPRNSPIPFGAHSGSTDNISSADPFAQFNLQQMAGGKANSSNPPAPNPAPQSAQRNLHPAYQPYYMQQNQHNMSHSQSQPQIPQRTNLPSGGPTPPRTSSGSTFQPGSNSSTVFPQRSTSPRPNYNPMMGSGPKTGIPQKPKGDAFGDLLGSNFNPKRGGESKPLKDLKAKNDIEGSLDPDRAKVAAWADRKERNIRALIGSLHEILWEGEKRWVEVGMHQLLQPDQVKKFYRKACLSVHPDKAQNTEHENLARAIFDELNDAYTRFEESGSQALF